MKDWVIRTFLAAIVALFGARAAWAESDIATPASDFNFERMDDNADRFAIDGELDTANQNSYEFADLEAKRDAKRLEGDIRSLEQRAASARTAALRAKLKSDATMKRLQLIEKRKAIAERNLARAEAEKRAAEAKLSRMEERAGKLEERVSESRRRTQEAAERARVAKAQSRQSEVRVKRATSLLKREARPRQARNAGVNLRPNETQELMAGPR